MGQDQSDPHHQTGQTPGSSWLPRHVAIIMDGNGRWAKAHGFPRLEGHRRGLDALRKIVRAVKVRHIPYLTVYSFSSENWRRPAEEVAELMGLLRFFIREDVKELSKQNVRIRIIGNRQGLPSDIVDLLDEAERTTVNNNSLTLAVAFNYGARDEIVRAVRKIAADVKSGSFAIEAIDEQSLSKSLDTAEMPDPDLIIRTSGELRLSNFLMWQAAYSELVFSPVCWPDFDDHALDEALLDYGRRQRRFGGLDVDGIQPS
jgi:undecaprenyl diphosphate synthase